MENLGRISGHNVAVTARGARAREGVGGEVGEGGGVGVGMGAGIEASLSRELCNFVEVWATFLKEAALSFLSSLEEAGCLIMLTAVFWKEALFATVSSPRIKATARRRGGGGGGGRGGVESGRDWWRMGEGRRGEGARGEGRSSEKRRIRAGVFCGGEGSGSGRRDVGAGSSGGGGGGGNEGQRVRLMGRRRAAGGGGSLYVVRAAAATGVAMMATVARGQEAGNLTVPLTLRGLQYTARVTVSGTDYSAVSAGLCGPC